MARGGGLPLPTITDDRALGSVDIQRSLRLNDGATQYLSRTPASQGDRRKFTISWWMKLCQSASTTSTFTIFSAQRSTLNPSFQIRLQENRLVIVGNKDGSSSSYMMSLVTKRQFRDPNGWYHFVVAFNTNDSTSSDRIKIYVNGSQITDFDAGGTGLSANTYPSSGDQTSWGTNEATQVIGRLYSGSAYFDGYLSEINYVDGSQLTPDSFGFTESQTGIWMPKRYEGGYGNVDNGFYLDFSDNSSTAAICIDKSPNGNDFTPSSVSVADSKPDTPTNNFCKFLVLQKTAGTTFSEGDLKAANNTEHKGFYGNIGLKSGKWYWEAAASGPVTVKKWTYGVSDIENTKNTQIDGQNYLIAVSSGSPSDATYAHGDAVSIYKDAKKKNGSHEGNIDGYTIETNDIVGVALDVDAGKVWYRIGGGIGGGQTPGSWLNGVTNNTYNSTTLDESGHDATLTTGKVYVPAFSAEGCAWKANFGQDSSFDGSFTAQNNKDENGQGDFYYPVPRGFRAICSKNLPPNVPSIRPQKHFDILTYTGNGGTQSITGLEFNPDVDGMLGWIKERSSTSNHTWGDTVRGANKILESTDSDAENEPDAGAHRFKSFDPNGFTHENSGAVNQSGETYVAWCWRAGGAAVANSDGATTSQVSANTEAGFSIVTYTGTGSSTTIGHGLGKKPEMIFMKSRSATGDWAVLDEANSTAEYTFYLNDNNAYGSSSGYTFYADTPPTSSVWTVNSASAVNASGVTYVAYCWTSIPGYSKIDKYTGNGSDDGTYVYLGFRPAWVMVKRNNYSSNWSIYDNKRDPYNPVYGSLNANLNNAESTGSVRVDFLSDGFKHKNSDGGASGNVDGGNYIYMAFAETPDATPFDTFPNAR